MGQLSLNQSDLLKIFSVETDLDRIIKHYEVEFEKQGEVICRININNAPLSEEDEQRMSDFPLSKISTFEIETENPNQLFADVVSYWKSHLPVLIETSDSLAQNIRFRGLEKNAATLSQFIDQCHMLVNSLNSIHSLCQHRELPLPERWSPSELKLWMAFNSLLDSFGAKNTNDMADSIEYDLADAFQNWFEIINELG